MAKTETMKNMKRGKGWVLESPGGKKVAAEFVKRMKLEGKRFVIFKIEEDPQ